jgi:hypothetical protein
MQQDLLFDMEMTDPLPGEIAKPSMHHRKPQRGYNEKYEKGVEKGDPVRPNRISHFVQRLLIDEPGLEKRGLAGAVTFQESVFGVTRVAIRHIGLHGRDSMNPILRTSMTCHALQRTEVQVGLTQDKVGSPIVDAVGLMALQTGFQAEKPLLGLHPLPIVHVVAAYTRRGIASSGVSVGAHTHSIDIVALGTIHPLQTL